MWVWVSALRSDHIPSEIASWKRQGKVMILMQHLSLSFLEKISSWWIGTLDRWGGKREEGLTAQGPIYDGQAKTDSPIEIPSKQVEFKDTSHFQWQALKNWRRRERRDGHYRSKFSTFYFGQREPEMHAERASGILNWSTKYYCLLLSPSVRPPTRGRSKLTEGSSFCLLTSRTKISRAQGQLWLYL